MHRMNAAQAITFALCAYEQVALATGEIPTLSEWFWRAVESPKARPVAWACGGFVLWHLFVRPESPLSPIEE